MDVWMSLVNAEIKGIFCCISISSGSCDPYFALKPLRVGICHSSEASPGGVESFFLSFPAEAKKTISRFDSVLI